MHSTSRRPGRRLSRVCRALAAVPALALAAGVVEGQTPAAPTPGLRLADVYQEVLAHNPRIGAARSVADAADAMVRSASLPPDPQLQFGLMNYGLPSFRPMAPLGMMQLQVMQMVPLPGKLSLAGAAARANRDAAREQSDGVAWGARRDAAAAFYDLYQTDQQLAVARRTLALLGDIQQTAQAMYRVGRASQADVLRAQVELARMTEDTLRLTARRTAGAARLDAVLDRDAGDSADSPVLPAFPAVAPARDSLIQLAERDRPSVRAQSDAVTAAERQRDLAARNRWPDLAVGVSVGQRTAGGAMRMGSLMVGAAIPVFAGSRQNRAVQSASAIQAARAADLRAARADTRADVIEAYADLTRARRLTALYRFTVLPQAEAAATSALASYRVGGVDFMTVLDDRMTVDRYARALHALESDEGNAWARLEALVARPLINANSTAALASGGVQ